MHGFVRKGLLLSAATGTLVMGYAGSAAAKDDSAVTQGTAAGSPGAVSGNVAQLPANVPIQVCGDAAGGVGAMTGSNDNYCWTNNTSAGDQPEGVAADSPGAISGNVASVAANVPVQACGIAAGAAAAGTASADNACVDDGTHAVADGVASDSPGLISGNVVQASADVPAQACGDSIGVLAFGTSTEGNKCVNGGGDEGLATAPSPVTVPSPVTAPLPVTAPSPVLAPSPAENCPPPPPNPCPPSDSAPTTPSAGIPALLAGLHAPTMPAPPAG